MKININKDFLKEYKNDFWKGFSMTDIVHIAEGFLCAGAVVAGLVIGFKIPITIAIYCAVPVAAPVIFIGFYKYQGYLSVKELVKEICIQAILKDFCMNQKRQNQTEDSGLQDTLITKTKQKAEERGLNRGILYESGEKIQ